MLRQGVAELGLVVPASAEAKLVAHLELIAKWNRVYNLTAIREDIKLVSHHLLDCLSVVKHLPPGRVVDVGSGAGLPGIPIAVACPDREVSLLESSHKKGVFLRQVVAELRLENVSLVINRVESYRPSEQFDVVISRAFSDLTDFVKLAGHLCKHEGALVAMKGVRPDEEIALISKSWEMEKIIRLQVPHLDAARHLVFLRGRSLQNADRAE